MSALLDFYRNADPRVFQTLLTCFLIFGAAIGIRVWFMLRHNRRVAEHERWLDTRAEAAAEQLMNHVRTAEQLVGPAVGRKVNVPALLALERDLRQWRLVFAASAHATVLRRHDMLRGYIYGVLTLMRLRGELPLKTAEQTCPW